MAEGIKIQIYRNETADVLTKKLADPEENAGVGGDLIPEKRFRQLTGNTYLEEYIC